VWFVLSLLLSMGSFELKVDKGELTGLAETGEDERTLAKSR